MSKKILTGIAILAVAAFVSSCTMRSYVQEKGRVDQEMTGNGGCIQGTCSQVDRSGFSKTRDTYVLEIDTGAAKVKSTQAPSSSTESNYDVEEVSSYEEETYEPRGKNFGVVNRYEEVDVVEVAQPSFTEYKIEKDDTLQKISQKFYGTVKRWNEIYQANKDVIKDPNRIKPGKTIRIPQK